MSRDRKSLGQDPQYDPFLHATVGDDAQGAKVTVLSMLARLGVDPWREASALAGMPATSAQRRLAALMTRFTDVPCAVQARVEDIRRLLAFLPHEVAEGDPETSLATPAAGPAIYWIVSLMLLLTLLAAAGNNP